MVDPLAAAPGSADGAHSQIPQEPVDSIPVLLRPRDERRQVRRCQNFDEMKLFRSFQLKVGSKPKHI